MNNHDIIRKTTLSKSHDDLFHNVGGLLFLGDCLEGN